MMLDSFLSGEDAGRATTVLRMLSACGLRFALTGGLAVEAQLRANGAAFRRRDLHDLDVVVSGVGAVTDILGADFLLNHIHPNAPEGKLLLQLVDPRHALRIDVFRAYGDTLGRVQPVDAGDIDLAMISIEDLRARSTTHVWMSLARGLPIDGKYVDTFQRLLPFGREEALAAAWRDHRQDAPAALADASKEALRLIAKRGDLIVVESYERRRPACERCRPLRALAIADPDRIADILGYC